MLTELSEVQRQNVLTIAESIAPVANDAFASLITNACSKKLVENELLFSMGQSNDAEYFVLDGVLRSFVLSPEGEEVTLNFFIAPCILSPSISRSVDGISQVSCEALSSSTIVPLQNSKLVQAMMASQAVQLWGDAVMRRELVRRTKREISLATHTARQRLGQLRDEFPNLENLVPHHMIASFIGVTPVTLSRLRND